MMGWLKYTREALQQKQSHADPFARKLEAYLRNNSGLAYSEAVLQQTVSDVLALDADLLEFVRKYVEERVIAGDDLRCDHFFTMSRFLEETDYTPVAAALLFQMYRWNPMQALKSLTMHDGIIADPQALVQRESES